jgi:hypothetical protein
MARVSNNKAKEKKQKIVLAVGGVLLLGLVAVQGPKFMKLMHGSSSAATVTAAPTTSTATAATSTASASSGTPVAASNKLASLSLFRAKDPFVQLVSDTGKTSSAAKAPAPLPAPAPAPAPAPTPAKATAGSGPLFGTVSGGGAKAGSLPTARILFNGGPMTIALGHSFPAAKPMFRLAGVVSDGVSISLVDGGLADGASALKLRKGQSLTLMNTVDRHRYTIKLVATKAG